MVSKKIKTVLDDYSKKRAPIQIPDGLEGRLTEEAARQIRLLFCDVTDYRLSARTKYPIREILLVIFTAVLCGYTDYEEIEAFGKAKPPRMNCRPSAWMIRCCRGRPPSCEGCHGWFTRPWKSFNAPIISSPIWQSTIR